MAQAQAPLLGLGRAENPHRQRTHAARHLAAIEVKPGLIGDAQPVGGIGLHAGDHRLAFRQRQVEAAAGQGQFAREHAIGPLQLAAPIGQEAPLLRLRHRAIGDIVHRAAKRINRPERAPPFAPQCPHAAGEGGGRAGDAPGHQIRIMRPRQRSTQQRRHDISLAQRDPA